MRCSRTTNVHNFEIYEMDNNSSSRTDRRKSKVLKLHDSIFTVSFSIILNRVYYNEIFPQNNVTVLQVEPNRTICFASRAAGVCGSPDLFYMIEFLHILNQNFGCNPVALKDIHLQMYFFCARRAEGTVRGGRQFLPTPYSGLKKSAFGAIRSKMCHPVFLKIEY